MAARTLPLISSLRQARAREYLQHVMSAELYMDAVITPNRSLSARGFVILISVITLVNCVSAAVFVAMGAHVVLPFIGVDILAVMVAFLVSYKAAQRIERIQVTARDVRVVRETPKSSELVWESPTAFTRVETAVEDEQVVAVRLALSDREAFVAASLSPPERAEFAKALQRAIWVARRDRG
jgi:uncharacterized membrane protein